MTARLEQDAAATGSRWARVAALRCRGLVQEEFRTPLEEALRLHADLDSPLSEARTELVLGQRLRRARQRGLAQDDLRSAYARFARSGARAWAATTATELRATGDRVGAAIPHPGSPLTEREQDVATMVGSGATNREAAAALFLSPKTVENDLGRIYAKPGIRSRTELAVHLRMAGQR